LANYLASTSLAVSHLSCLSLSAQTGGDLLVCCRQIQLASFFGENSILPNSPINDEAAPKHSLLIPWRSQFSMAIS
jgi:hypothetical protein